MLASTESEADFSAGCVRLGESATYFSRPSLHPSIREWLYASTVSDHSHRGESLFTGLTLVPWQQAAEQ
jgi:hypothetical protein